MSVRKICVLGLNFNGVPLSAIIALKCPEIRVCVVQKNSEFVYSMNTGQIPPEAFVPGMDHLIRKCQNRNLFFTTNEKDAIKDAEVIFVISDSRLKMIGDGKKQAVDLSVIEDAAYLIAENAENNKIVVESSSLPLRTAECVRNILRRNGKPKIEFEVVSNPEFYEHGSSLRNLLNPDYLFIGSENTPKNLAAAKLLSGIYERWIPNESIFIRNIWSAELSKICTCAMIAQIYSSIQSLAAICEEMGGSLSVCKNIIGQNELIGKGIPNTCFNVGKFPSAVRNLVYLCESYNLSEEANYWREVLEMFNFTRTRLLKNVMWKLNGSIANRPIVLLGFAYYKDTEMTDDSSAIEFCSLLLDENARINIYDQKISKKRIIDAVVYSGCQKPTEEIENSLSVFDDPYKAIQGCQVIILCSPWSEFADLDYPKVFKSMKKPAYIYDTGQILPHSLLVKIGFNVYAFGGFVGEHF